MSAPTAPAGLAELAAQVRALTDRAELQDMVFRYASACDRRDEQSWRRLFTPDARAKYGKDDWLEGASAIVAWLMQATAPTTWGHHFVNPYSLDIHGDDADVLTYLVSHQVFEGDLDAAVMMTSRYQLHCRRSSAGWQISELILTVGWFEARHADQSLLP